MSQRIYRIIFLLFVAAGAIRLSAQAPSSEVGLWIEEDISGDFDGDPGYGISLNHYWTESFSTELSAQKFSADATLNIAAPVGGFCGFGELPLGQPNIIVFHGSRQIEVTAVTAMAQLHFNRAGRIAPYLGAGVAHLSGDAGLESEITWAAAAGLDLRMTDRLFLTGELKFVPWSAIAEDTADGQRIDVDPLIAGVGVKMRF
jgi:opacity protein-like surface antigen